MQTIVSKEIDGLITIEPEVFYDFRGENVESFNQIRYDEIFKRYGLPKTKFVVDSFSFSRKDVIRGFHGDWKTWKILQCLQGTIQLVVIDLRKGSKTQHNTEVFQLNDKNRKQVVVPAGCVNAHLCISDTCIFSYKLSNNYVKQEDQLHVHWNDSKYEIYWPLSGSPITSVRDAGLQ
jgi:dTDP-4-dehydrorhamnose 3,5-epimerase